MDNPWILLAVSISNLCPDPIHARVHGLSTDHPWIPTSGLETSKIPHFCLFLKSFQFYVHEILVQSSWSKEEHYSQNRREYADHLPVILGGVKVVILVRNHRKYPKNEILIGSYLGTDTTDPGTDPQILDTRIQGSQNSDPYSYLCVSISMILAYPPDPCIFLPRYLNTQCQSNIGHVRHAATPQSSHLQAPCTNIKCMDT